MPRQLLHPKYWLLWCLVALMRLLVLFPYRWQLKIGSGLGLLAYKIMSKRRRIAKINIDLCFPEKTEIEREHIVRASFKSLGQGVMEALMAWFMSERRFAKIPTTWIGVENYQQARAKNQGILLISGHFPCMELIARKTCEQYHHPLTVVFKKSHHPFFEYLITSRRKRYLKVIKHVNMKAMVDSLRNHETFWYAPDQDFGRKVSLFSPWFNIPTATVTATSLLAEKGNAIVIPAYFRRLPKGGYEGTTLPPLENFPSGNIQEDCDRWQKLLEDYLRKYPDQYLWIHKRFKTRPEGVPSVY